MTTFKLTPTQKRELLAGIITHKIKHNQDIIPYVGRNLGDFNYLDLLEEFYIEPFVSREIADLYLASKYKKQEVVSQHGRKYKYLTDMEGQVFDFLLKDLEPWIGGESYSITSTEDIIKATGIKGDKLRGVLSSLTQKNVLESWEADVTEKTHYTEAETVWETHWAFVNQQNFSTEDLIKKVS